MAERKRTADEGSTQSPAVLTGHTNEAGVVKDPVTGKVQALHTTTVVTDPESDLAVQGHDDPRVNGTLADPLNREPSPNEIADGASIPASASDSHSQITGDADEDQVAAGVQAEPSDQVESEEE